MKQADKIGAVSRKADDQTHLMRMEIRLTILVYKQPKLKYFVYFCQTKKLKGIMYILCVEYPSTPSGTDRRKESQ